MTTAVFLFGLFALIASQTRRAKVHQQQLEDDGWSDEPEPDESDVEYADYEPCWLPPRRGDDPKIPERVLLREGGPSNCPLPQIVEPRPSIIEGVEVPFAEGSTTPVWPVVTKERVGVVSYQDAAGKWHGSAGNAFTAKRYRKVKDKATGKMVKTGELRYHVGIDLGGEPGDLVVATEKGKIVAIQSFTAGTWAILEETDTGIVVLYGEVAKGSWSEFGIKVGVTVEAGQALARIGVMGTKDMLHFETYVAGTRQNISWAREKPDRPKPWERWGAPPKEILDPSRYLVLASVARKTTT